MSVTNLLEKLGMRPVVEGHVLLCACPSCGAARAKKRDEIVERRARGIQGDTLAEALASSGTLIVTSDRMDAWSKRSFWLGVTIERLMVLRGRDKATLEWAAERGWSNSLRAEHGRQQRGIDAHEKAIHSAFDDGSTVIFQKLIWQGILCERYIMLVEGRLSLADKRRMGMSWLTDEENVAHMMIDLMHSTGRIGPNGFRWMKEQLHLRAPNQAYERKRARDILGAALHLMESSS